MILSESEKLAIEKMREDYSALEAAYNELKIFKEDFDVAELKAKKDEIFAREEYSILVDNDDFNALKTDMDKYSVEELDVKAELIFAKAVKSGGEFSAKVEVKKSKTIGFANTSEKTESAYGGLFD